MNLVNFKRTCQFVAVAFLATLVTGTAFSQGRNHDGSDDKRSYNRSDNRSDKGRDNRSDKGRDNRSDKGHVDQRDNRREKGHDNRNDKHEKGGRWRQNKHGNARFSDHHRKYYNDHKQWKRYKQDHVRRYTIGRQLPRDVIFYEAPQTIVRDFGPPPHGYRYVRVSNDILLISVITGLVLDALQN